MRRIDRGSRAGTIVAGVAALLLLASAPRAQLVSRSYVFKPGVILETAVASEAGLRLDSVYFDLPRQGSDRLKATDSPVTAVVAVSNTTDAPLKAGLALALFDDEGRLLAAASGGSGLASIKPGRQRSFTLVFDGAYAEAHRATVFQISLEPK